MSLTLGSQVFPTKAKAEQHYRAIAHRYPIGAVIAGQDGADVAAVLDIHPSRAVKVGVGVSGFSTTVDDWGHPCFVVRRTDRTSTDFSYREALSPTSPLRKFKSALRRAVWPDLRTARDVFMARHGERVACAVTGTTLFLRGRGNDAHIDHRRPNTFEVIATRFIAERSLTDFAPLLAPHVDNDMADKVADSTLALAFRQLHWSLAELDFLTSNANLSTAARLPRRNPPHIILREWIPQP